MSWYHFVPKPPKERRSAMYYALTFTGLAAGMFFVRWEWAMPFVGVAAAQWIAVLLAYKKPRTPRVPPES